MIIRKISFLRKLFKRKLFIFQSDIGEGAFPLHFTDKKTYWYGIRNNGTYFDNDDDSLQKMNLKIIMKLCLDNAIYKIIY